MKRKLKENIAIVYGYNCKGNDKIKLYTTGCYPFIEHCIKNKLKFDWENTPIAWSKFLNTQTGEILEGDDIYE